jgi:hypothetical protein
MKLRKLTESEVTFTVELEPEETAVRGNAMVSGDDAADRECEDTIIRRLDSGQQEAWCCLVVRARWEGFEGIDTLGCCSFDCGKNPRGATVAKQAEKHARDYSMHKNALIDLNRVIAEHAAKLAQLVS